MVKKGSGQFDPKDVGRVRRRAGYYLEGVSELLVKGHTESLAPSFPLGTHPRSGSLQGVGAWLLEDPAKGGTSSSSLTCPRHPVLRPPPVLDDFSPSAPHGSFCLPSSHAPARKPFWNDLEAQGLAAQPVADQLSNMTVAISNVDARGQQRPPSIDFGGLGRF